MRLTDFVIAGERYRGEPTTDEDGRTQWPTCVIWDDEVQGLGVRIQPPVRGKPSRKDFIVTWRVGLKSRTMAIGTYGVDCTLRQARRIARQAIDLARRGRDPIQERQHALGIGTTEDLASRFLYEHTAAAKRKPVPGGERAPDATDGAGGAAPEPEALAGAAAEPAGADALEGGSVEPVALPETEATEDLAGAAPALDGAVEAPATGDGLLAAPPAPPVEEVVEPAPPREELVAPPPPGEEVVPPPPPVEAAADAAATPAEPTAAGAPAVTPPEPAGAGSAEAAARRGIGAPAGFTRGPTKMRMLALPASLHREIERRAQALGLTLTGYLQALVELETSAAEKAHAPSTSTASRTRAEEIFSKLQTRQPVDAPKTAPDVTGDE